LVRTSNSSLHNTTMIPQRDSRDTTMVRCISGSVPLVSRASTTRLSDGLLHKVVSSICCLGSVACAPSNAKFSVSCLSRQHRLTSLSSTCVLAAKELAAKPHSRDAMTLGAGHVQLTASFRELLLTNARLGKHRSTKRSAQNTLKRQEPARSQNIRSRDTLLEELTSITSEVIGTTISADAPLMSAGFDSISAMELWNKMSEHLDTELPQTLLFDHPTLQSIADSLPLSYSSVPLLEPQSNVAYKQLPQTRRTKSRDALLEELTAIASEVIGTTVSADAPLLSAGLDSISTMEL